MVDDDGAGGLLRYHHVGLSQGDADGLGGIQKPEIFLLVALLRAGRITGAITLPLPDRQSPLSANPPVDPFGHGFGGLDRETM